MRKPLALLVLLAAVALAEDKNVLAPPESGRLAAHGRDVSLMSVSSHGTWLLTASFQDKRTATVFDGATGKPKLTLKGWPANLSPDGTLVAVFEAKGVAVYDIATGALRGRSGRYNSGDLCISHDGALVAAAFENTTATQEDNETGWHVVVRDIATGKLVRDVGVDQGPAGALGFGPGDEELLLWQWKRLDNRTFATVVTAVELKTGKKRILTSPDIGPGIASAKLSPDGTTVAWAGDESLALTSIAKDATIWKKDLAHAWVSFDADGSQLTAKGKADVLVLDAATGEEKGKIALGEKDTCHAVSGEWLLAGTKDGEVVFSSLAKKKR
jgi:WD40 repeat protein